MRSRLSILLGILLLVLIGWGAGVGVTQEAPPGSGPNQLPNGVLFEQVRIFDGLSDHLSPPSNVLVIGNQIQSVGT